MIIIHIYYSNIDDELIPEVIEKINDSKFEFIGFVRYFFVC